MEVILNNDEVSRFREALTLRIAGVNTRAVRNTLEELLYKLGATISGGEPPVDELKHNAAFLMGDHDF